MNRIKCVNKHCSNHTDEGYFIGLFCYPCYVAATETDFRTMKSVVRENIALKEKIKFCSDILKLDV